MASIARHVALVAAIGMPPSIAVTGNCLAASAAPSFSDEAFTTTHFPIVQENVSRITKIEPLSSGTLLVIAAVGACHNAAGSPTIELHVHGSPAPKLRRGELIATGGLPVNGRTVSAIRTIDKTELQKLSCVER